MIIETILILLSIAAVALFLGWAVVLLPQRKLEGVRYTKIKRLKNKNGVQMIAHRGLSGLYLENTVPSFEAAGKRSFYGIETDVHVTKDGKFIVTHDDDLKRIAGLDLIIEDTDYETLRALRFQDPYGGENAVNAYLPCLDEYISICKKYDKQAVLELKNEMEPQFVTAIAKQIEEMGWLERTTFISFSAENLLALREKYPTADAQFLVDKATEEELDFMIEHRLGGDLCWSSVRKWKVERLHRAGLKVNCWTVDGVACAKLIARCGVDFITSNIIE